MSRKQQWTSKTFEQNISEIKRRIGKFPLTLPQVKLTNSESRAASIKKMQDDLRALKKSQGNDSDSDSDSDSRHKRRKGPSYLEQELSKYQKGRGRAAKGNKKNKREEEDLLAELGAFSKRVTADDGGKGIRDDEVEGGGGVEEGLEVDDDVDWMKHRLKFDVDEKELTRRAEDEYSVSRADTLLICITCWEV
jgi:peptidyl-prolyl cis-trans isomerase SDCCAG10